LVQVLSATQQGFAKMGQRWMGKITGTNWVKNSVEGSQGSLNGLVVEREPSKTLGSSMKRRIASQAASRSVSAGSVFPRAAFWIALFVFLAAPGLSSLRLYAESASSDYKKAQTAEAREDYDAALENYQRAYEKDPKNLSYRAALYRVRVTASSIHMTKGRRLLQSGDDQGALAEFMHAAEVDPGNEAAQQEIAKIRQKSGEASATGETSLPQQPGTQDQLDSMGAPPELKPLSNEPLTLHMTEDSKVIYQAIGRAAGVNILFDPDYISKRIQVDLNNVSLLDALRIVGTMSNTFWRPVTPNTIFVAQNTRAKRTEMDEQAIQTFYLSNAWQQNDLNDVQTALRNVLGANIKVYGVQSQNAIVVRGTPDELLLSQKLVNDLDKARAEVVVDIAVLEVSKNWERTLGIAWPSSVGVALQPNTNSTSSTTCPTGSTTCTPSTTGTTPTLFDLAHLKATDFAVTVGSATANLLLTDSNTKILQNPRIRATDAQKATMKIGERIPIATGSYQTGAATAVVSSLVNTQFQYQDVGVNIEMTPTVHYDHDVTLKIKIEVTSQSGSVTISGVTEPILSQRVVDQVIRLREGEASILGGIQDKQDMVSWTGIPGLSSIPIIKYLFGSKDHTISDDELVFLVIPHIVRSQSLDQVNLRTIDTGSGTSIELRHIANDGAKPAAVHSGAAAQSSFGIVPGQSAQAAAPAALAQMRASADASPNAASAPPPGPSHAAGVSLMLNPPAAPITAGSTFQVPVVLTGGTDIASVPMQISYDPSQLSLVNVDAGDFLGRDGQSVALVHRDDGPGNLNIVTSRPPGAAGISGAGVVCVLSFQAKTAGQSALTITRPAAVNSAQQQVPAQGSQVNVVVH
jgi:general secretion pathway protein D